MAFKMSQKFPTVSLDISLPTIKQNNHSDDCLLQLEEEKSAHYVSRHPASR